MEHSIAIIKKCLDKFDYRYIQYFPTRHSKFIGNEFYVLCSFLFKKKISVFNSTAFYPIYEKFLRFSKPELHFLYRLLFHNDETLIDNLMYFFNKDEIKALRKDMFLLSSGNRYRFKLRLIPISNLLVISSPAKHEGRFDYVHIGYDTFTLWNFLKKKLKREKVANALEIGCGAGFLSLWMSRFADSVTAADINQKALDLTSLNARINNINNIITVKSDVYTRLNGKYNFIISNPPFELLPDDKKNSLHAYGGHLGMEITCKILSGLDAHLKKDGIAYIMANSYIKKSGQDTLNNEIENILGRQCFAVTMFEFSYQIKPGQCFFYKSHGISHSIAYLIQIQRSERFSLTVIQLKGISRLKENLRVKLLSHLCKNDV